MRPTIFATLALVLFAGLAAAQTTGIPLWNDYTINGDVSGSTSCNSLSFTTPITLDFEVSTASAASAVNTVYLVFSPGPCQANSWGGGCVGTTFDLQLGWPMSTLWIPTDGSGLASWSISLPPLPPRTFSTQAVIIDQVACPGQVLFTQAYDVDIS